MQSPSLSPGISSWRGQGNLHGQGLKGGDIMELCPFPVVLTFPDLHSQTCVCVCVCVCVECRVLQLHY